MVSRRAGFMRRAARRGLSVTPTVGSVVNNYLSEGTIAVREVAWPMPPMAVACLQIRSDIASPWARAARSLSRRPTLVHGLLSAALAGAVWRRDRRTVNRFPPRSVPEVGRGGESP
jgi:hypothetical protein